MKKLSKKATAGKQPLKSSSQQPMRPSLSDEQFRQAVIKARELDKDLQPAVVGIYRHLLNTLESPRDRDLLNIYGILQMGSHLSIYAPHYLLATETNFGEYLDLYTTWARKAQGMLQATEKSAPITRTAPRRKNQNKTVPARLEG